MSKDKMNESYTRQFDKSVLSMKNIAEVKATSTGRGEERDVPWCMCTTDLWQK